MGRSRYPEGSMKAVTDAEERLTGRIIGSAMEVHRVLGPGFLESIYHEALVHQLGLDGISCQSELEIKVSYKGMLLGRQRIDLLVESEVVLELKAISDINSVHKAQLMSYLRSMGHRVGLLLNFDRELLQVRRVLNG